MNKKLSVIIAAYNAAATIKKCINSIFDGVDEDVVQKVEVIVVDDGSTDETAETAAEFKDRIKLIRLSENGGRVAKTRNIGLAAASGEYITFLDADDYYERGAVAQMFDYIGEFKPDIVRFGCMIVCPDKIERIPNYNPSGIFFVDKAAFKDEIYPLFISGIKLNSVCLAAFRCDIAKGVCFPEKFRTAEDAAFALEIYTNAESVLFVPDRLYRYVQSGGGLTGSGLGIFEKLKYNFMLVPLMLGRLEKWGMNTFRWKIKTVMRPLFLAADKIKRMK